MQQHFGRPALRERTETTVRRHNVSTPSSSATTQSRMPRMAGEPAKFNTRNEQLRIILENDLYERQSM